MSEQEQNLDTSAAPAGTLANEGQGETPAGGTANPPVATAAVQSGETTLAEHIDAHVATISAAIDVLEEKKQSLLASTEVRSDAIRGLLQRQAAAINAELAVLHEKKESILAVLENLPEEIHGLEARVFAALKHIF